MQKLRPYIIPGLFLFHLVLLCVMIFTVRGYDPSDSRNPLTEFPQYTASLLSQFFLTALWAGLGSGPWSLRIPGCGALAALSWIGFSITFQDPSIFVSPGFGFEWILALVVPLVAWDVRPCSSSTSQRATMFAPCWLTARMLRPPMPPAPIPATLTRSLGGVCPGPPSTCRGTMVRPRATGRVDFRKVRLAVSDFRGIPTSLAEIILSTVGNRTNSHREV